MLLEVNKTAGHHANRSKVMEHGGVEGRFRVVAAVAEDDVNDHVFPSNVRRRGGVTLQPSPMATVNHHLSEQETQRPLADHTAVDQWDNQTKLAVGVSMETDLEESSFHRVDEDQLNI